MIKTNSLREADIRYFDCRHNGLEFSQSLGKVILVKTADGYDNLLCPGEVVQLYDRSKCYSNVTSTGFEFGSKVVLVQGESVDGEAWLLNDKDFSKELGRDIVSMDDIYDYLIRNRDVFYRDRESALTEGFGRLSRIQKMKTCSIFSSDRCSRTKMQRFMEERLAKVKEK